MRKRYINICQAVSICLTADLPNLTRRMNGATLPIRKPLSFLFEDTEHDNNNETQNFFVPLAPRLSEKNEKYIYRPPRNPEKQCLTTTGKEKDSSPYSTIKNAAQDDIEGVGVSCYVENTDTPRTTHLNASSPDVQCRHPSSASNLYGSRSDQTIKIEETSFDMKLSPNLYINKDQFHNIPSPNVPRCNDEASTDKSKDVEEARDSMEKHLKIPRCGSQSMSYDTLSSSSTPSIQRMESKNLGSETLSTTCESVSHNVETPVHSYDFWESKKRPSGKGSMLFRGHRLLNDQQRKKTLVQTNQTHVTSNDERTTHAKQRALQVDTYSNLTDSLVDDTNYHISESDWHEKLTGEHDFGLDAEESRYLDRQWYDCEESSYFQHEDYINEDITKLREKEEHLKFRQSQIDQVKRRQKLNLKESLRNADQELWEMSRLRQSGVPMEALGMSEELETMKLLYEFPTGDGENDSCVHVLVREIKPPFLDGRIVYTTQSDTVPIIRDPTADMAVVAKRGSAVVRQLREQEDRTKMRQRFWELGGSTIGKAIGVKSQDKTSQQLDEECRASVTDDSNYKKDSQFAKLLMSQKDTAASNFSKTKTIDEQRKALPIYQVKHEFFSLLRYHQVLVVIGQTGSGKTTQLTQYLLEEGYGRFGVIGCTQPRRVAAVSVAKRVADEVNTPLGEGVGYAIRFEDCTSVNTVIQYMTDGILLRESLTDPDLDRYSVIIMDEAHERSLNTDILFGVFRGILARRRDFRLIVTSATMNAEKFSAFFGNCPVFDIPGRTFPVRIEYSRVPVVDYVDAAVQRCLQIHCSLAGSTDNEADQSDGDILVFMTGQEDIEAACYLIADRCSKLGDRVPPLAVLPIYSTLASDLQAKIFERNNLRKVIVATNIAETSLTVDGIKYVIDCGYSKLKVYNPKMGMDSLQICPISQANAQQRSGRAGRTGPGVCYRMYTERAFLAEMFENNIPEIQRTSLCHTVLLLKSLGIESLLEFDFMDPPPQETILNSMYQLWILGALDNLGYLTNTGSLMVQFPLDPPLSKMLLTAVTQKCTAEVLTIVSMLSVPSIFFRPKDRAEESDAAREKFFVPESDHLTLLNTYHQWKRNLCSPQWSNAHFIHQKAIKKVGEVRAQLLDIMQQQKIPHISSTPDWDVVRKAICSGYFHNAAKIRGIGEYVNLRTSIPCHLHPSSSLFGAGSTPEYIVYHEVVLTTKEYMQNVTAVEPVWLAELGPMFFYIKRSHSTLADKRQEERSVAAQQEKQFQDKIQHDIQKKNRATTNEQQQQNLMQTVAPGSKRHKRKSIAFPPLVMTESREIMDQGENSSSFEENDKQQTTSRTLPESDTSTSNPGAVVEEYTFTMRAPYINVVVNIASPEHTSAQTKTQGPSTDKS